MEDLNVCAIRAAAKVLGGLHHRTTEEFYRRYRVECRRLSIPPMPRRTAAAEASRTLGLVTKTESELVGPAITRPEDMGIRDVAIEAVADSLESWDGMTAGLFYRLYRLECERRYLEPMPHRKVTQTVIRMYGLKRVSAACFRDPAKRL